MYTLVFDKEFVRDFDKLDYSIQNEAEKKIKRLKESPKEIPVISLNPNIPAINKRIIIKMNILILFGNSSTSLTSALLDILSPFI